MTTTTAPLALLVARPDAPARGLRLALLALAGSALLTLSAKLQVPFWPVPMTMQTYVVLVLGMAFGPRLGAATVLLYLAEGALGLPVFAGTPEKGIGVAYMIGPTGGYLLGFVVAAALAGALAARGWDRHPATTLAAAAIGTLVIFGFGVGWLAALIGFDKAIVFGLQPFVAGAMLKIGLVTVTLPLAWKLVGAGRGGGA